MPKGLAPLLADTYLVTIMKRLLCLIFCGLSLTCRAAEAEADKQAEVVRSVSGTLVDDKGKSKGEISIKKGDVYEVASDGVGSVTLRDGEKLIKVPGDSVKITEVDGDDALASSIRIVKAKLSFPNDSRDYEVKQEVKKFVKKHLETGPITTQSPVKVQVSDELLRGRAGMVMYYVVTVSGVSTRYRRTGLALTITYEFEGKRLEKTGREGSTITLP